MLRLRPLAVLLSLALGLCLLGLWGARSQTTTPRRVTNTSAEGLNLNPSLSGDGRRVAFESTEDVAGAGGGAFFRAIRADLSRTPAAFVQLAGARAPAPGISQDGSIIAFAAKDNPLGTNADGNSEIFLHNGASLRQITNTTPNDMTRRATDGNFQPSLSDDGRFIAFSSNRNLTAQNSDGNFEIFVYDAAAGSFSQLTSTAGGYGSTDAKISGDGSRVAYIKDSSTLPAVQRDLMLQDRTGGVTRLAADNVTNLSLTYGRAISDDGARVVFAGDTAANSSQVFLYDARTNSARAVTALEARETEVPLHPTISGDGTRIAFAARRTVPQLGGNGDHSIELYTLDLPTGQFAAVTDAPSDADGFQGSTRVAEVVSSLSDDGSTVAFNFPRSLSGEVDTGLENNSEIYVSGTTARPTTGTLEVLNGASFGHEPSTEEAVAPESYAVATGGALAFETVEAERQPDGTYPTTLAGTTVTVQGRRAQLVSVSPTRVDFLVPADTPLGDATVVVTNEEGFRSIGTIEVKTGAPGIFTKSGDGTGEGEIVNAQTGASGPFDPTGGELRLLIYTTGVRNASEVTARAGGHTLTVESVTESATRPGTDEVRVKVPAELRGAGPVDLFVRADDRDSNPVTLTFLGVAPRPDIVINELLADPPADDETTTVVEGDANRDGVRDTSDDEFVELVNASGRDLNISGYQLFSRSTTGAEDNLRHTFAPGTIFPAGTAVVVFGGGNFNPRNQAFGGAQVFKASEGELSLVNGGGTVTLRDASARLVTNFSWGGSTGFEADDNQSLTRSPDVTGAYTQHTTASGSNGKPYSPGTRVNGQPFTAPAVARIEVTPASASIAIGQTQQFTARAFNASGNEMSGVIFTWESSAPAVASVDENGLATGKSEGTTEIRARARGSVSAPAPVSVRFVPRELTSVEVSPTASTIPVGGQQQFTARGLDQFGNEMTGLTFTWESTNPSVATVDSNGLATGLGIGTTTIRASAGGKTGTATLNVTARKIVINEALADPPGSDDTDLAGDANRDGVRDASQDEFVELVNSSSAPVDISGWTIRTRTLDGATETLRHTFAPGTSVPAGSAVVVFGGGTEAFDPAASAFGCAQVVKASSGRLSLLNSGETIVVTDASGNLTAQLTYGSAAGLNGGADQSMTRSPDVTGDFTLHTTAPGSGGRAFSPGLRVDGTPFGNCPARLTSVTIQPASQSVIVGRTTQFTAQARDQFGRPMKGVAITFVSDNTSVATVDSVTTDPATGVATATVRGRTVGTAHITARATTNGTTVASDPATLSVTPPPPRVTRVEVTPAIAAINRGGTQKFTARAFNGTTQVTAGVTYTWTSSDPNVATVDQNGLAKGVGVGTVTITATAPDGLGGTVSDTAQLTVRVPLVINEILADVPTDNTATRAVEGDANRDGVRSSGDDEFLELLNNTNAPVDISGVLIADGTSNRFTIPAGTILAAGRALVIFGGGEPPADDPNFGGALVIKIPGSLSLNDTGDTVFVKLPVGGTEVVIASESYGEAGGAAKASDQSLARSPDASVGTAGGALVPHTTVTNADGRVFSPGTRTDGTPFGSPAITRMEVTPASATVGVGGSQAFTARAFANAGGTEVEVQNVSFIWDASDPSKAEVAPTTGQATTATALAGGSTLIRARAGSRQAAGTLNINFPPVARVEVTPATATIPVGGTIQFTARAFDASNQEIAGAPFTWSSSNTSVATIDGSGVATGVSTGATTIKATAGGKNDTAALTVVARTITINEVLADPPADDETTSAVEGDANRDGVRDTSDDEFVELVNALNRSVNLSGWSLRTRSETAEAETVRHTFADGTTLPAGRGVVIFGGGEPNQADPAFGGSQVLTASTGRLSLTNNGLTVILRDAAGNLVARFTYGGSTELSGDKDQSLTRSPDVTGDFVLHAGAANAVGRTFSPGTRTDGTPFGSPAVTRMEVSPASATVNAGATQSFIGRAFGNAGGTEVEIQNVSFVWDASDPTKAEVAPTTGQATTAKALAGGSTSIRARAGGKQGAATLTINFPPVSRIEVTPATATIPVEGAQQFTAHAFDAGNNEIPGFTFTWTSSNTNVATVDSSGVATGVGIGTTTIKASAGGKSGTATLNVVARTVAINEVLADPPEGLAGDANRDGVRDSSDDEFVELVNALGTSINLSGWTLRTRTLEGTTETVRHTFADGATLAAGRGVVVFGGGSPNAADPAFGGAQVVTASTGRLSLTNSGLHIVVRDASGNLVAQFTYGGSTSLNADKNQSLTRSPDVTGDFVLHAQAPGSDARVFSPGTRADGTPFGSPPITRIQIVPATATVNAGTSRVFTARAFSNASGTEVEVLNVSFVWDSSNPNVATVSPSTGKSTNATALSGGTTNIRARAGGQAGAGTLNVNFPPVERIEVTPATATIPVGGTQQFTAHAFDAGNNEITGLTFTWTSSNTSVATIDSSGVATGVSTGATTITASAKGKSGTAALNVVARTVTINEILADPPEGLAGDANRDGVRDSADDEFVELVNALNSSINIAGWTLRTRSLSGTTETLRHTFDAGTTLAAGKAIVVFGGGTINAADPAFGGSQVVTTSTSGLSLTNSGLTILLRDASGNLVAQFTYGGSTGLSGDKDQSLTRSPDITGDFAPHTTATNSDGRRFSPGTRADGTPFGSPPITRIQIVPASATLSVGGSRVFTARAFSNTSGTEVEVTNVSFVWDSSDPSKATVSPATGKSTTATAHAGGSTAIRARAGGQAGAATLTINFPPVSRIEVTPATATIPVEGAQQFTAHAFDASNNEIPGFTFTWSSSNTNVATVDANGVATGVGTGTTTIKATAGGKSGTATLTVVARTITINEVLADPPEGLAGDANRDGVRDSSDDEFVELVNALNSSVNIAGWTIRTRSLTGSTETLRHTFADGATLAAGRGVVVFGGGTINAADPAFGGAQVVTASAGRLSLTNSGLHIVVRDASGNLVAQLTYGGSTGLNADANQSLTRSPDVTGDFALHTAAANAAGRVFSPGTRADGTPFGSPAITRIEVLPASATVNVGGKKTYTARAYSNASGTEVEVLNVSFIWDSSNPNVATVFPATGKSTTATALSGGNTTIRAQAGGQQDLAALNVNFPPVARIEVSPATATIPVGGTQQFTAHAFDAGNNEITGLTFTWTSSNTSVATIDSSGVATGVGVGSTTITASAKGKSGTAALNIVARTVTINEVLADPPEGLAGDANRDGVRDSSDDELVELVNALGDPVNISGWTIRTRSLTGSTETLRHTFADGATLPAGKAVVVFGGGSPNSADPAFGGAQVVTASTGRLSLTNSGLHVIVRDASGNLVAQLTYGGSSGLNADANQSLTRSPDITGDFVLHTAAANADGRVFSPGTRTDGTPFGSPAVTRIEVTPASATVSIGGTKTYTARAFSNASGTEVEVTNVSFIWDASDPSKAAVSPTTGRTTTATALAGGSTTIRARAGGQAGAGTLNVSFPPVARVEVTPETATIPVGGTIQFTARAFDASNNEIPGVTFTWTSGNKSAATIDSSGVATGVGVGATTIKATAGGKNDTAALTVVARTVTINEILADPPDGLAGDANRDGVRDSADDEFVELVNALNTSVNISGWTIRTRSLSGTTESLRHTFDAGTTLPSGRAIVVFGGGTINAADPAFGGAQVVTTSTSGLSLTNSGLHIVVRDSSGNLVAQLTYGSAASLNGDSNQSLTRSPDITGGFALHTTATNAAGRVFSPGTRADGTPFGSPAITRIEVTPASATVNTGGTQQFTARAFSNASGPEVEVTNVSFIWDSSNPSVATVSPATGQSTTATAHTGGSATIRARAGGQASAGTLNVNFPPVARVEVTPETESVNEGGTIQFTARAFDAGNNEIPGITFTWTSTNTSVATVDQNGLATGVGAGTTTITASAGGHSDTATLNVLEPNVVINELLADPQADNAGTAEIEGDANHDGVRDTSDDEFVELVNRTSAAVNISGWTIRTRSLSGTTETLRHTFADNTTLPANDAIVVFGGGAFDPFNPAFGGAQVVAASTGGLSLTNTGLHVVVRDAAGEFVTEFTYGSAVSLNGDADQSLTRSPDVTGDFVLHTQAAGASGRRFSPGRKVDGSFFVPRTGTLTSVTISPASASVIEGQTTQFTAQAFDHYGQPMTGVTITFESSNTSVATVESVTTAANGVATATVRGQNAGSADIKAKATDGTHNVESSPAALTVTPAPPRVTSVEVSPASATINRGGTQQFTATAFDGSTPVSGVTFTWTSSDTNVATVDSTGLATGVGIGTVTITATAPDGTGGTVSDTATLDVQVPLIINEILADPPAGATGDANRDGTTNTDDDEFVEVVNNSNAPVDVSGVVLSDSVSNRFTFPAGTTLAANQAAVIFGGGTPSASDPNFGGALIFTTSSLGLNNTGDTVTLKLAVGGTDLVVATETYGSNAGNDQSLTRSPDLTGAFEHHTTATNSNGRLFSPGTRLDGTPFGSPAITRIEVTPATASLYPGETQQFTAKAFSNAGGPEIEVPNVSFYWKSSNEPVATVAPTVGQSTTATGVAAGTATISALAGGQAGTATLTVNPVVASIELAPATASVAAGSSQLFTATARDSGGNVITGLTFSFSLRDASPANAATITGTTANTVTVRGDQIGSVTVVVNYTRPNDNVTLEDTSALTITAAAPLVDHVEVSPATATINRGGTQQFTATAFDSSNQPVPGATFTWTSSNTNVATVDSTGLATGVGIGTTTITAETSDGQGGTVSDTATLNVQVPLVINEILADPPAGATGNANRDGATSTDDDEFVELLNNSNAPVDISGVVITDLANAATSRFTFPAGTILAAGRAVVVFGGGTPPSSDPAFGGALVLTVADSATSSSTLNLNNTDETVTVKLNVGGSDVQIDQVAYGGANPAPAPSDQSLTRSPDAEVGTTGGSFVAHSAATNAHNRIFSPGTRADGTPFGSPAVTRIEVTPAVPAIDIGDTQQFTGKAFSNAGGPEIVVPNVSFFWTSSNTPVATVAPLTGQTTTATAHASGSSTITAFAGGQNGTAALTVNAPPPSLSIADVSLTEGDAGTKNFTFTVQLSGPAPAGGVTFDIETADNTATDAGNDYEPNSATAVTIPATQSSTQFTVLVNGDLTIEPNETFFVNVTNVTGATVSDAQGVGTIQNDDSPSLSINDVTMSEGDAGATVFTFTVHSSLPAPAGGITFNIATADGTAHDDDPATEDNDYVAKSLTSQTIAEGTQDYTFEVTVNGDTKVEPDETFFVNLSGATGATISDGQGLGTIQNDDAADLVISQVYPGGGNAGATYTNDFIELFNQGTTTVDFSVTNYSVQYAGATANFGSTAAANKTDITSGTIAPGQYFLIQGASGGANGVALPIADATGVIAMSVNGGKVALVSGTAAVAATSCPGDDGTPPLNPSGSNIVDFVGYGTTAACYEGSGPAPFSTSTAGGLDPDARSTVRKSGGCQDTNDNAADFLNPVSAPIARNTASPTNSCVAGAAPNLTINNVTAAEGNSGTTIFTFTVSLSAPAPSTDVFFDISTQNNTATTANSDYVSRTLTNQLIPAGQQTYTFSVTVNGDAAVEPDETFFVNVTNVTGATLSDGQGVGTIQNDEVPSLSINDVSMSEGGTGGTTVYTFTVHLSSPAIAGGVQFDISTADDTATDADNDYEPKSLTNQTIAAGNQDYTFDVTVNGDTAIEPNETFFVNVTNVTGASLSDGQGLGTIQNDDDATLVVTKTADTDDQVCDADCSLREATFEANSNPDANIINFQIPTTDPGYNSMTGVYTITLTSAILISQDLTMNGLGANVLTISGNQATRIFSTQTGVTVMLDGLTIRDGAAGPSAGAIDNSGVMTVSNSILTQNAAAGGGPTAQGGAINNVGTLTIIHSTLSNNSATSSVGRGGAISNSGTLTITDSTLSGNSTHSTASGNGSASHGGAIFNSGSNAVVNLINSTLSGNSAVGGSSTPFGGAQAFGGAIYNAAGGQGVVRLTNCTLSGNNVLGADLNGGGGIYNNGGVVSGRNTIIAQNDGGSSPDLFGAFESQGHNIIGNTSGATITNSDPYPGGDKFDAAASPLNLGALQNNGGATETRALGAGSVAIDAGDDCVADAAHCGDANISQLTFDQRGTGFPRKMDGNGDSTATVDIGAYEVQTPYPSLSINDVTHAEGNSGTTSYTFTVTKTGATSQTVTVDYATADGTATEPSDYTAITTTQLTFAPNETTKQVTVLVNGDTTYEPSETFTVHLSNAVNATISDADGTGTIQNDDSPALSIDDVSTTEGNAGTKTYTFTVHLSQPAPAGGVSFDISTQNNTAVVDDGNPATISDNDYVGKSLTGQTIPETAQDYQFTVTVNGDTVVEPNESFFVNVTNVTGATVADGQGLGTIQNDDTPDLVISQIYPGGGNTGATYTNDFIEIFNQGTTTIDFSVTPYSVQYAGAAANFGAANTKTDLVTGTIGPGQYFLIQEAAGANAGTSTMPTPDLTGGVINLSATAGKVALVLGTTAFTGTACPGDDGTPPPNPSNVNIVDFVGYGSTANCFEGSGPAPFSSTNSAARSTIRTSSCTDSNNNSSDFSNPLTAPTARNKATTPAPCP